LQKRYIFEFAQKCISGFRYEHYGLSRILCEDITRARKILRALVFLFPSIYSPDTFIFLNMPDPYAVIFVNRA